MNHIPLNILYLIIPIVAALFCWVSIPKIILIAKKKKLFDIPDNHRKIHKEIVPNLGGIGIFFSYMIVASLFIKPATFHAWGYIVSATMILFLAGIKDDIVGMTPTKKFIAEIIAAIITVYLGDIRLFSLHGIFGIHVLPGWYSIGFSIIGCVFVTNAFNLIDGIDGLAGSISVFCSGFIGAALAFQGNYNAACIAFSLMGAIIGFLKYNIAPAKIFMGDSGSLFIGFTMSVLCIIFINSYSPTNIFAKIVHTPESALIVALSILFIPIFDSFRVFTTRIMKGHHPFHADRTHLHHFLLDLGFSHSRTVTTLLTANFLIVAVSLLFQDHNPNIVIAIILLITLVLFGILYFMRKSHLAKTELIKASLSSSNSDNIKSTYKNGNEKIILSNVSLEANLQSVSKNP